jgi:RNA polymerase sigma factor (sigma-70 family)
MITQAEILKAAKNGDRQAVSDLLARHSPEAYRVALHILRNPTDAEDATQSALIQAFTHLDRFDATRPFTPWLLRIVVRESLKLRRAERTRFGFWQRQRRSDENEETVEEAVAVKAEHEELWRAVNRLRDNDRLVLTLSYFMGFSEMEVATVLGIRRGTVKSRKHNALLRLRALVERDFPGLKPAVMEERKGAS